MSRNEGKMQMPIQGINIKDLSGLVCLKCQNTLFGKVHQIKFVPALLSPTGQDFIIWIEDGAVCTGCGNYVNDEELHKLTGHIKLAPKEGDKEPEPEGPKEG